jgi:hypothetical protein
MNEYTNLHTQQHIYTHTCWGLPQESRNRTPLMMSLPYSSEAALSAAALHGKPMTKLRKV